MEVTCPNCKTHFETAPRKGVRKCCKCGNIIERHDKWFFNQEGKVQHRHCDFPTLYVHPDIADHENNKKY